MRNSPRASQENGNGMHVFTRQSWDRAAEVAQTLIDFLISRLFIRGNFSDDE